MNHDEDLAALRIEELNFWRAYRKLEKLNEIGGQLSEGLNKVMEEVEKVKPIVEAGMEKYDIEVSL